MNLLIVDDEVEIIQGILSGVNWDYLSFSTVLWETGVEKTKELLEKTKIDIILCDIEMPDGSGLDLLEWIKQYFPEMVCVILTCHENFVYARRALELGCRSYLLKPLIYGELQEKLQELYEELQSDRENIRFQNFGRDMVKQIGNPEDESELPVKKGEMVATVKAYIRNHLKEELRAEELAALVYVTPDYLTRIFKKEEGMTPLEFLVEERMFLAEQLLKESRLSISRVAYESGYDNYSYFTKLFKKKYGVTPREYRKKLEEHE